MDVGGVSEKDPFQCECCEAVTYYVGYVKNEKQELVGIWCEHCVLAWQVEKHKEHLAEKDAFWRCYWISKRHGDGLLWCLPPDVAKMIYQRIRIHEWYTHDMPTYWYDQSRKNQENENARVIRALLATHEFGEEYVKRHKKE